MKISLNWLNNYLDKGCTLAQAQDILETHGFPVENVKHIDDGAGAKDVMLDVEVTSNRGDCLSHVGLAREIAAGTNQQINFPDCAIPKNAAGGKSAKQLASIENSASDLCSLYTARIITGVKVATSPKWLVDYLSTVGVRPVNNIVDITNFVLMELGQPLHAFDLNKLSGRQIRVRTAKAKEKFKAIDASEHELDAGLLVIADKDNVVAAAGVMGGKHSEVAQQTTDILLEAAVFDPVAVRTTSRRLKIPSDASYRYERRVDQAGTDLASSRAAKLILEIAGGELADGVLRAGAKDPAPAQVSMRTNRCNSLLGENIADDEQVALLSRFNLEPKLEANKIICTIPTYRKDLTREADLIEEIARLRGMDKIPLQDKIHIVANPPQNIPAAERTLRQVLTAHGDCEAITLGFVPLDSGELFLDENFQPVVVSDERRKAAPMLRPSLLPGLLACRKDNQDRGNTDVRLYEVAGSWQKQGEKIQEQNQLAIVRDATDLEQDLRKLRSTIQELVERLGGSAVAGNLAIEAAENGKQHSKIYAISAAVKLNGQALGTFGVLQDKVLTFFGIQNKMVAAELNLPKLLELYPPQHETIALPRFPPIERDLSLITDEAVSWQQIENVIKEQVLDLLEDLQFITVYRGKPIEKGKKSVSLRMSFRDPKRTLRHEQVNPQMESVTKALEQKLGASLRTQ